MPGTQLAGLFPPGFPSFVRAPSIVPLRVVLQQELSALLSFQEPFSQPYKCGRLCGCPALAGDRQ